MKFHLFLDGNKRSVIYLADVFIELNYLELLREDFYERLEDVVVAVASDEIDKEGLQSILSEILVA